MRFNLFPLNVSPVIPLQSTHDFCRNMHFYNSSGNPTRPAQATCCALSLSPSFFLFFAPRISFFLPRFFLSPVLANQQRVHSLFLHPYRHDGSPSFKPFTRVTYARLAPLPLFWLYCDPCIPFFSSFYRSIFCLKMTFFTPSIGLTPSFLFLLNMVIEILCKISITRSTRVEAVLWLFIGPSCFYFFFITFYSCREQRINI